MKTRHVFKSYRDKNGNKKFFDVDAENKRARIARRKAIEQAQKELEEEELALKVKKVQK